MAKCVKCDKRKGKRHCPALGQMICNLCCGQFREKEIPCPPSCSFLAQHKPYQDQRILERTHAKRPSASAHELDILSDERLAWLAFNIELPIAQIARKDNSLVDRDVLVAIEYAREKVEKEKGLLIIPGEPLQPKNELGEAIFQNLLECRYEKKIIVPGSLQMYKRDEKIRCLDRVVLAVKHLSGDHIQGRRYLKQLIDRLAKLDEISRQSKIIAPSS
jgi:hypothetical protein